MNVPSLAVGLFVLPLAAAVAVPAPPEAAPALRLDDRAVPLRMAVDLTVAPDKDTFAGVVEIDLLFRRPSRVLWLNGRQLTVGSAEVEIGRRTLPASVLAGGEDFVRFDFGEAVAAGPAKLRVRYTGILNRTETAGLFKQRTGDDWYVFSQLEAIDARRAFPCFDEPQFKVPWRLTLHVPRGLSAFANTGVESEADEPGGMKRVRFAETRPLPSYLVALAVGPFEVVDAGRGGTSATPIRIIVPRGRAAEAAYARKVTGEILGQLESYFGIPYPFGKLDSLAVPHTVGFSAMENPGLITYAERVLLIDPARATETERRRYADVAAHEIAHQWFGDLVTLAWWDDTWLNEGFADWMGAKALERWQPEWGRGTSHVHERDAAMAADRLVSARKVRQEIVARGDIDDAFDAISYEKGAAVLDMFESWMGPDQFRRGVQDYLRRHADGSATSSDFLAALAGRGDAEVAAAFSTFLDQPGLPLVSAELRCAPGPPTLLLAQRRYLPLGSPGAPTATWRIPVHVRYGVAGRTQEARLLLTAARQELPLTDAPSCPDWLLANADELGYYVVDHRGTLRERLVADRGRHLTLSERVGLLADLDALARSGDLPLAEVLEAAARLADDRQREIVESAIGLVERAGELVPDSARPAYATFVRRAFGARAAALGLSPRPSDDDDARLLRPALVRLVADQGEDPALRAAAMDLARRFLADPKAVDPALVSTALRVAARGGGSDLFDLYLTAARRTPDSHQRSALLGGLAAFRSPALVGRALDLLLGSDFDIRETWFTILHGELADRSNRDQAFGFVKHNLEALRAKLPEVFFTGLPLTARRFCDDQHRADAEAFFRPLAAKRPESRRPLAEALESIRLCAAYKATQQASLEQFLAERGSAQPAASRQ